MKMTLIGFGVGILGTGIGGSVAFFLRRPSRKFLSIVMGLSGGLMVAIVTFELLPEAFVIGGTRATIIGLLIGTIIAASLDSVIARIGEEKCYNEKQSYLKAGILLGLGIALHNFPEGLAIGSGFMAQDRLGLSLAIVIALHNIPEGVAMVTPMRVGGYGGTKAFLLTLLAGAPMGLGACLGALMGEITYGLVGICLAFAGGTMLYITFGELIPKGKELYKGRSSTVFAVLGFIMGLLITKRF